MSLSRLAAKTFETNKVLVKWTHSSIAFILSIGDNFSKN